MIAVEGLTRHYGGRAAVDAVSFQVGRGRVAGFVGPNGAGKSTTMRMMVGLTRPDEGDVRYGGTPLAELSHPARVVGAVLDVGCIHPGRSARNHLRATAAVIGAPAQRVEAVLDEVGLDGVADRRARGFSLGMRQRLALAGALLGSPEVLLLDEPSNGLDPDGIRWLRSHLRAFADAGGTVLVSSHLIGELAMFADDLVVLGAGRVLAAEPLESILARRHRAVSVDTPQPAELVAALDRHGLIHDHDGRRVVVQRTTAAAVWQLAFDERIRVTGVSDLATSLEDVLVAMTAGSVEFSAGPPDAGQPGAGQPGGGRR